MSPRPSSTELPSDVRQWAAEQGCDLDSIELLAGDVSLRQYSRARLADGDSAILAFYPESIRDGCSRFSASTRLLASVGVDVPGILASDCRLGAMLLEDIGSRNLYDQREGHWDSLRPALQQATEMIRRIASLPLREVADLNPPLDRSLLESELRNTWDLVLGAPTLAAAGFPESLDEAVTTFLDELSAARLTPTHRDFMARNLHLRQWPSDRPPGLVLIDHQDLRLGPHSYDLASLLNDSLYPPEAIEQQVGSALLSTPEDWLDYHRAAAQRTLKIVGTFVGFARRGFPRHLSLIEPSLRSARRHLVLLPEMKGMEGAIDDLLAALQAKGSSADLLD